MNTLHSISSFTIIIIAIGLYFRRQPKIHIPLMLTAFVIDISEVLYIELNRHAIKTAVSIFSLLNGRTLLMIHIAISLVATLLYFYLIASGFKLLKDRQNPSQRAKHKKMSYIFITARLLNFITSFLIY